MVRRFPMWIPVIAVLLLLFGGEAAMAQEQEVVTLKVLAVSGHEAFNEAIRAQERAFNEKYDNIRVEIEIFPGSWPQFEERFTVLLAAGAAPDLVHLFSSSYR